MAATTEYNPKRVARRLRIVARIISLIVYAVIAVAVGYAVWYFISLHHR